ncbi:MAG TPA: hypothetical protein PLV91_06785 [Verrucomicrobiota bacterium]|jgi:anti-sigma factor RsiW|nr:hypothetical protein [Verrucomicrobiota bacterium]
MGGMEERLEQLIEKSRKGRLTQEEHLLLERFFDQKPALYKKWKEECKLNALFSLLPEAPLSSDFTEQVLKKTFDSESTQKTCEDARFASWISLIWSRPWLKHAVAACVICLLSFGVYYQQSQTRIHQIAESLSTVAEAAAEVAAVSETDLEAIQVLGSMSESFAVDNELWLAMVSY